MSESVQSLVLDINYQNVKLHNDDTVLHLDRGVVSSRYWKRGGVEDLEHFRENLDVVTKKRSSHFSEYFYKGKFENN